MKATNSLVTYDNLTTMGLTAKGSPATGNRIATKQFIIDNYYVQEAYLSAYSSNQCPPYQNIIGASINGFALGASSNSGGQVLLSSNAGDSWSVISQFNGTYYDATDVSSSGQYMLVVATSTLYLSSNYGSTWSSIASIPTDSQWINIAISDDSRYIIYVTRGPSGNGNVYISNNYGASFSTSGSPGASAWRGVAMSSSGQYITLTSFNSYIWVSSNYGVSYTAKTAYPSTGWIPVVMSQSGQYQVAGRGTIYRSSDYGSTWTNTGASVSNGWAKLAISGDGRYLLGLGDFDPLELWRSTNYGTGWSILTAIGSGGNGNWRSIAIAPDGITQLVGASGTVWPTNYIWKSTNYGANFGVVPATNIGWTYVSLSNGAGTTTTTTTTITPSLNYYNVTRYRCFPCRQNAINLIASSSVALVNNIYYNNGDGYVYYINYGTGVGYVDVDLDGSASDSDCLSACSI